MILRTVECRPMVGIEEFNFRKSPLRHPQVVEARGAGILAGHVGIPADVFHPPVLIRLWGRMASHKR
jgi:hypothetical protein